MGKTLPSLQNGTCKEKFAVECVPHDWWATITSSHPPMLPINSIHYPQGTYTFNET